MDHFLKNDGSLFTSGADLETTIIWLEDAEIALAHMGPPWVWVQIASRAILGAIWTWWRSLQSAYLGGRPLKHISWEEFLEVFYYQFFSYTVVEEKKLEFMALTQKDMIVAEYHARFLALERFASGPSKHREGHQIRLWADVESVHLNLHVLVCDSSGGSYEGLGG